MSHGSIENAKVKRKITESLFMLLKKKKFSEITVTDIVSTAGVARASYYRNFDCKEAIIEEYMDMIHHEIIPESELTDDFDIFSYERIITGFERSLTYFLKNKSYILILYKNGFGSLIQEILNRYIEDVAGDMPCDSIERYKLYFIAGAVFNVLVQWLENGAVESPLEIATACADFLSGKIVHKEKDNGASINF